MRMRAFHGERDDGAFSFRRADDAERVNRRQKLVRVGAERFLMRPGAPFSDPLNIIEGGPKPDGLHDWRIAGLGTGRRMGGGNSSPRNFLNHLATALVWRQLIEKLALTIEPADSSRAINLVPSE